jgi:hypothetical protein
MEGREPMLDDIADYPNKGLYLLPPALGDVIPTCWRALCNSAVLFCLEWF